MEYIDLRKVGKEELKEIHRQVVRPKELGKTGCDLNIQLPPDFEQFLDGLIVMQ